ncbi:MAG: hypothetical protein Q9163_006045, partial [Psora crenata]
MATNGDDIPGGLKNLKQPPMRKERLRLGYSEDSLRSRAQDVHVKGSQGRNATKATRIFHGDEGKEDHKQPGNYSNINELAAPPPVDEEADEREPHLEDHIDAPSLSREETNGICGPSPFPHRGSRLATELYTVSYLIFFSLLGTLARLGIQALTFYPGAPVQTGLLWANVGGCLAMGFLSEDQKLFREGWAVQKQNDEEEGKEPNQNPSSNKQPNAIKKTIPLYIGLATGFCGSFTSFSSFMRDAFYALANALPVPISHPSATAPPSPVSTTLNVHRNPGYSFMAVLAVLIITLGLSMSALQAGAHLALALDPYTPSVPMLFARRFLDRFFVLLACGCWLAGIFMAIFPPDRPGGSVGNASWLQETWRSQALFALVFAPLGCLLRFYASLHLNGRIKSFPCGTFAANIFGTAMAAMLIDLQHAPIGAMLGCQVLQ